MFSWWSFFSSSISVSRFSVEALFKLLFNTHFIAATARGPSYINIFVRFLMLMQYVAFFMAVNCEFFLIFAKNINCGQGAVLTTNHILCFRAKIMK